MLINTDQSSSGSKLTDFKCSLRFEYVPIQFSLGAALSSHAALDGILKWNIGREFAYNFASPRVGDNNFVKYYKFIIH